MVLDKKVVTAFVITSVVIAGTALASYTTTTFTTQNDSARTSTVVTTEKTSTTVTTTSPTVTTVAVQPKSVQIITESPETILANTLFRILGIPVTVSEITSLKTREMGYGEITLAYNLAHASGESVDRILDMRFNDKMGWGKIAKVLGVKLHGAVDNSVYILREAKFDMDADNLVINIGNLTIDDDDANDDHDHKEKAENKTSAQNDHHNGHGNDDKAIKHKANNK